MSMNRARGDQTSPRRWSLPSADGRTRRSTNDLRAGLREYAVQELVSAGHGQSESITRGGESAPGHSQRGEFMQLGMIGWGRMGANMVRRLMRGGHQCVVFDRYADAVKQLAGEGAVGAFTLEEFVGKLQAPKAVWLM